MLLFCYYSYYFLIVVFWSRTATAEPLATEPKTSVFVSITAASGQGLLTDEIGTPDPN